MANTIILEVNGEAYSGWSSLTIRTARKELCGTFELALVPGTVPEGFKKLKRGDICSVMLQDEENPTSKWVPLLTNAKIESLSKNISRAGMTLSVSGRDGTGVLIDSSTIVPGFSFSGVYLPELIRQVIKPYDLYLDDFTDKGKIFNGFKISPGETCFAVIEKACRQEGVIINTNQFGELFITYDRQSNETPAVGDLIYGVNILEIDETESEEGINSEYIGKAQYNNGISPWVQRTSQISATAKNLNIGSYKPLIFTPETMVNKEQLQKRVNWECQTKAGELKKWTVRLIGWTTRILANSSENKPWRPNTMVNLEVPELGLTGKKTIDSVTLTRDKYGMEMVSLDLIHPDTYRSDPPNEVKFYVE